jgi:hypothetical protein
LRYLNLLFRCAIAAVALVAAYYSALYSRASFLFQQDTGSSVEEAVDIVPYNGEYTARLAAWQPDSRVELLHRAVELDPYDAQSWIRLGLDAEMQKHDLGLAEHDYLQAYSVDHMYVPRVTLANFYFRHQMPEQCFRWSHSALEISPFPPGPLFAQLWLISQDAQQIATAIPDVPPILTQYAQFLSNKDELSAIPPIISRLISVAGSSNPGQYGRDQEVAAIEDRLLGAGALGPALEIWRSMKQGNWIRLSVPTPEHPLTNGDFAIALYGHGFDWNFPGCPGVSVAQSIAGPQLDITFSGDEPEHCGVLQEYVPVAANTPYILKWIANGGDVPTPSGLTWRITSVPAGPSSANASGDALLKSGTWEFTSGKEAPLSLLTLEYTRPLGSTRLTGTIELRSVSLEERRE